MIKHKNKQTRAHNSQAKKERNKSKKMVKDKNKQTKGQNVQTKISKNTNK